MITLQDNINLIKKVLGDSYTRITIKKISIEDPTDAGVCGVSLELSNGELISRKGKELLPVIFTCLKDSYREDFPSLYGIEIINFKSTEESTGPVPVGSSTIQVKNSYGTVLWFESTSESLLDSVTSCCCEVIEYFVNSHKAYTALKIALQDAEKRGRVDLVDRFVSELSVIVKSTSYERS